MHISVIVTTYNNPQALKAVLQGYALQSDTDFDVIVADDGSARSTRNLIDSLRTGLPFELIHVWQEDQGFRAAAIRNRAIAATSSDYIIFTDGDCIPSRHFVARHRLMAEPGWFLSGNRVLLNGTLTQRILRNEFLISGWSLSCWLGHWVRRDINRLLPFFCLPDGAWRKWAPRRWQGCVTANLSAWRHDLLRINGFDESYSGWGLEDSDLAVRLIHAGIYHKNARFGAFVWHLWHPQSDRVQLPENQGRFDRLLASDLFWSESGLDQYGHD
ncbi:MAG: glycosyltransferase family 2 protein [Pseudomonadota bacterium]|nr:glycosyltransferase family 2 protein [Pseudomonadota bacterium]